MPRAGRRGRRIVPRLLGGLLLVAVAWVGIIVALEDSFIYYPTRPVNATPAQRGLAYEDVSLTTADGVRLHAWWVPGQRPLALLWLHGNGGNIGHRVEHIELVHRRLGVDSLVLDYRGYGRSEGHPSEQGTYRDADAALAYLRARRGSDGADVVVFGQSLGAAIAVDLAARERVGALVLEAPFTSIAAMARVALPFLPLGPLLRTRYDSLSKIGRVQAPLLVPHSRVDGVIPYEQGQQLFAAAPEPKRFHTIVGAGHNDAYLRGGTGYWQAFTDLLQEVEAAQGR